jgi:hypothetical protein
VPQSRLNVVDELDEPLVRRHLAVQRSRVVLF